MLKKASTRIGRKVIFKLLQSVRPILWIGICFNVFATSLALGSSFSLAVWVALILCLISGFAFVINDYFDKKIDSVNSANRTDLSCIFPLFNGSLSILAIFFAYYVLGDELGVSMFLTLIMLWIIAALYSIIFSRIILLKNISAAVLAISPVWIFLLAPIEINETKQVTLAIISISLMAFILAREIRFDEFDKVGDAVGGRETLPLKLNARIVRKIEYSLNLAAVISLIFATYFSYNLYLSPDILFSVFLALLMFVLLSIPLSSSNKVYYYIATRLAMLLRPFYILAAL